MTTEGLSYTAPYTSYVAPGRSASRTVRQPQGSASALASAASSQQSASGSQTLPFNPLSVMAASDRARTQAIEGMIQRMRTAVAEVEERLVELHDRVQGLIDQVNLARKASADEESRQKAEKQALEAQIDEDIRTIQELQQSTERNVRQTYIRERDSYSTLRDQYNSHSPSCTQQ